MTSALMLHNNYTVDITAYRHAWLLQIDSPFGWVALILLQVLRHNVQKLWISFSSCKSQLLNSCTAKPLYIGTPNQAHSSKDSPILVGAM